jgi:multidrug efflux pump subunit AcrA (membrane-fusion protein)
MNEKKKKPLTAKGIGLIVLLILALAGGGGFLVFVLNKKPAPVRVRLAAAESGKLEDRVSASGTFQSETAAVVGAKTAGILRSVNGKPGDRIPAGFLLAEIDDRDAQEALTLALIGLEETERNLRQDFISLRSDLRKAELAVEQARRTAANAERLRSVDGISQEALRKAREEAAQAEASSAALTVRFASLRGNIAETESDETALRLTPSYRRAALNVEAAKRSLAACRIVAEKGGTITELPLSAGDRIQNGGTIAKIEDLSAMVADVNVDEADVGKLQPGMKADITADSVLGKTFPGTILRIWPVIKSDGAGKTCRVRLAVESTDSTLRSGASCMARIFSVLAVNVLTIPASALIPGSKPPAVFVAEPAETAPLKPEPGQPESSGAAPAKASGAGASPLPAKPAAPGAKPPAPIVYTAVRREIALGMSTASRIQVVSGLAAGELVAVDKLGMLKDGQPLSSEGGQGDTPGSNP